MFLEQTIVDKDCYRFADNPFYKNPAFIDWLSPFYTDAFKAFARICFQHLMDEEWTRLLSNPMLANSHYEELCWQAIESLIQQDIETLTPYVGKSVSKSELNEISPICDFKYAMMLQHLPAERFAGMRDEIAYLIMEICIAAYNETAAEWARYTIGIAVNIAVNDDIKNLISAKKYEMEFGPDDSDFPPGKIKWKWPVITVTAACVIIIIVLHLIRTYLNSRLLN
ncbi:MAG: hypothetical protein JST39_07890 [Bacteroidetes bacterium]|nr:hypothetical protein [Bacteroidota bacterium]